MSLAPGLTPINPAEQTAGSQVEYRYPLPELVQRVNATEAASAYFQPATPDAVTPATLLVERLYDNPGMLWRQAFAEADALAQMPLEESPREQREGYATEKEVFHEFLETVMSELKGSGAYHKLKNLAEHEPESITEFDVKAVFEAYERALRNALRIMKPDLTKPQRSDLQEAMAHLDWGYKDVIANHVLALADGAEELMYDPADIFLLIDVHARRIEYTSTAEARQLVTHFGSRLNKEAIQRDINRVPEALDEAFPDELAEAA